MPLNIDWQQILLHLFNFAILAGGLYFLLYKPVKDFMDKRTEEYRRTDEATAKKLADAQSLEKEYTLRLEEAEKEIAKKSAEAAEKAEKAAEEKINEAKKQQEKIISEAKAAAERQKKRALEEQREEIIELAAGMAEKILHGEDIS